MGLRSADWLGFETEQESILQALIDMQVSIMGKSLGGATAIHLASANPGRFRTIVVENTFTSIEDVAHKVSFSSGCLRPQSALPMSNACSSANTIKAVYKTTMLRLMPAGPYRPLV